MREITIKIYTFDELTKEAQEKILEKHRYKWCPEYYDAEHPTIREFVHTLTRQGFAVNKMTFSLYCDLRGGFTGKFVDAQAAIHAAFAHGLKENAISKDAIDEIRKSGVVAVSKKNRKIRPTYRSNTHITLLIGGTPMTGEEKYLPFVRALEEWKEEECWEVYKKSEDDYRYYISDTFIKRMLLMNGYEFYENGDEYGVNKTSA